MNIAPLVKVKASPRIPQVSPGDTVRVSFKIREANRERFQNFPGLVIRVRKRSAGGNFTIRRVTHGVGVEHTFPVASPLLDKVEVVRHGKVRRAKLYYIRELSAKEARLKERREKLTEKAMIEVSEEPEASVPIEEAQQTKEPEASVPVEEAEGVEEVPKSE